MFRETIMIENLPLSGSQETIRLTGRFDFGVHREFREAVKRALQNPAVREIQIDLGAADYVDSAALGMLLLSLENAKAADKTVTLANNARGTVKGVLDLRTSRNFSLSADASMTMRSRARSQGNHTCATESVGPAQVRAVIAAPGYPVPQAQLARSPQNRRPPSRLSRLIARPRSAGVNAIATVSVGIMSR